MRVNFEFDSTDEFRAVFEGPARDIAEANAETRRVRDILHTEQSRAWKLEDELNNLKARQPIGTNYTGTLNEDLVRRLLVAAVNGEKIQSIKLVREMFSLGLKEAKDLVEQCGVAYKPAKTG